MRGNGLVVLSLLVQSVRVAFVLSLWFWYIFRA